jgi:hypothetical protein
MSGRKPRHFTPGRLLKLSVTSGISVVLVRFLRDEETASAVAWAISTEVAGYVRRVEIEMDAVAGYCIRFHLVDHAEPPPDWEVVEKCAKRIVRLAYIIPDGYQELCLNSHVVVAS